MLKKMKQFWPFIDVIVEAIIMIELQNYSFDNYLMQFSYCVRKLYLQKVLGLYEPIKEATFKGSFRHELHDLASKADEEIDRSIKRKLNMEEIKGLYLLKYKAILRRVFLKIKD